MRKRLRLIQPVALLTLLALNQCTVKPPSPTALPPGFVDEIILNTPVFFTSMDWAPDGRLFLAAKDGPVFIYADGALLPDPFIDISDQVNTFSNRGLNSLVLDPHFETNGHVYLLYVSDPPNLPMTNEASSPDGDGARASRLMRVTADPDSPNQALAGSEVILLGHNSTLANMGALDVSILTPPPFPPAGCVQAGEPVVDCLPADGNSHSAAGLAFGPDGALYVGYGDGSRDWGEDARALRALDLDSLAGKVLRINPDTGAALPDNPFYDGDLNSNRSRVFSYGLRNPYRIAFQPSSGELFVGDVGWTAWEEINVGGGANFGWPCLEGGERQPAYADSPDTSASCQPYYELTDAAIQPLYRYSRTVDYGAALILGNFNAGTMFPAEYQGALFFADYANAWIKALQVVTDGPPTVTTFLQRPPSRDGGLVHLSFGPDGALYYIKVGASGCELHRIHYVAGAN